MSATHDDRRPFRGARTVELVLFAVALAVAGLVTFALLWSGTGPYADMARDNQVRSVTFVAGGGRTITLDLPQVVEWHRQWSGYITGGTEDPPRAFGGEFFTEDEYSHMADVRRVFDVAKFFVPAALVIIVVRLQRARARSSRDMWCLVRDGSLLALAFLVAAGLFGLVAFDQLFLAFHYVFFPQGNFLFPPSSNLIRLYPEWYWEGVSSRVGLSFVGLALGLAALASLRLRALNSPR